MEALSDIQPQALADKLAERLHRPPDLVSQSFAISSELFVHYLFLETIADKEKIEKGLAFFAIEGKSLPGSIDAKEWAQALIGSMSAIPTKSASNFDDCVKALLEGYCVLLIPRADKALLLDAVHFVRREVSEPKTETTVRGPHEGFTEDVRQNIALLRKRLKNPGFRIEQYEIGTNTRTKVIVAYLQDLAPEKVVSTLNDRLQAIRTDGIIDSSYVEEWIQDKVLTPFPTLLGTERPDVVTSHLLEGRVAVLVDGSPFALIAPITFFQFFIAPEDYYQRADIATLLRWLRVLSFLLAIFVPSLFIAIVLYHHELLPNPLLINIAAQREGVPFPVFLEAIMMLTTFEVLREAGLRMPRIAGQAISIVGALVLGEAAVQAGLVTAAMVIVVAVTAISNFVSPSYSFGIAQRLLQFSYMALAGFMGLYGVMCGVLFTIVHLASMKSFGVPYLAPLAPTFFSDWKDILVRVPQPWMKTYPRMNRVGRRRR